MFIPVDARLPLTRTRAAQLHVCAEQKWTEEEEEGGRRARGGQGPTRTRPQGDGSAVLKGEEKGEADEGFSHRMKTNTLGL